MHLALGDIRAKYRGTYLGLSWFLVQSSFIFILMAALWSSLFKSDFFQFAIYLGIGLAAWNLVASSLGDSTQAIQLYASMFLNSRTEPLVAVMRRIFYNLVNFLVAVAIPLLLSVVILKVNLVFLLVAIMGLIIVVLNLIVWCSLISLLGVKYRDLTPAMSVLLQALWVASPILYKPEMLDGTKAELFTHLNPLAWFLMIIRDPLMNENVNSEYYLCSLMSLTLGIVIMTIKFKKQGRDYVVYI